MTALLLGTSAPAQSNTIPIFQFAIFYNHLLEFTWCAPMTIYGRVHANADIYTGSAWHLNFNNSVSATGSISSPPWSGYAVTDYTVPAFYANIPATNSSPLTFFTGAANTSDAMREIINMPSPSGDTNAALAALRYYNKAGVILLVSNTTISAIFRSPTDGSTDSITARYYPTNNSASNYVGIVTNFPFLNVTNFWATNPIPVYDDRENDYLKLTDIDVRALNNWLFTNAAINAKFPSTNGVYPSPTNAPNIMYVADNRSYTNGYLTAVRLKNATTIPTNLVSFMGTNYASGFTLATPNPLYIYGNYNVPNSAYYGSTNTTGAGAYPASLISDALTILSGVWDDKKSAGAYGSRNIVTASTDVTLNAAIITGSVYSTGSSNYQFSGGMHNLPRLLESWSGSSVTLTLNTSFVNLFNSVRATNQFVQPGVYYNAPASRIFNFDSNFLLPWKLPPGTPVVGPAAPSITSPPQSQTILAGQGATFSVQATGQSPMGYQWQLNGTNIAGATSSSFTITNATAAHAGNYSVILKNNFGSQTNSDATLTVTFPTSIIMQPFDRAATSGSDATFSVTAAGSMPISYQWLFNNAPIVNATNAILTLTGVQSNSAGVYSVVISNTGGAVTSAPASLFLVSAPDFLWARSATNATPGFQFSGADSLALDNSGNVFVAGRFSTTSMDLGGVMLTNESWPWDGPRYFICKYSEAGQLLWAQRAGTNVVNALGAQVGTDTSGNVYLAGQFTNTATFGTNTLTSINGKNLFVVKYDPQGQILWTRQVVASDPNPYAFNFGFAVTAEGDVFLASRAGGAADFGTEVLTNSSGFIAKYDTAGNLQWTGEALGADAIAIGTNGSVYLSGAPGVLAKYDELGDFLWSKPFPIGLALKTDAADNVYATGYGAGTFDGFTITNSNDFPDMFTAKCDSAGHLQWLRQIGGIEYERGSAIDLDEHGNVYVTSYSAVLNIEPTIRFGTTTLTNVTTFLVKYDSAGNPLWARPVERTGQSSASLSSIAVKDSENIYAGGAFSGTLYLGPLTIWNPTVVNGLISGALFVAKLNGAEIGAPPVIASQPVDQVATTETSVTFSVIVPSGIPLSYQWYFNATNAITGATNTVLNLTNVQVTDAGSYSVFVTNAYGWAASDTASLTVNNPPFIDPPLTNLTLLAGQNANFSIAATGTAPLAFQWQFNGTNLDGATDATLSLTNISLDQAGQYGITVTNIAGAATSSATLAIYATAAASLTAFPTLTGTQFQFSITGVPGFTYVVEASTNFNDWESLLTNTSPFSLIDDQTTNYPARFFRSVYVP